MMRKNCPESINDEEVMNKINATAKLIIRRALRNVNPNSRQLYRCIEEATKYFYKNETSCDDKKSLTECDCSSEDSLDLDSFCECFKTKPCYTEKELNCFADVILDKLDEELKELENQRKQCTETKRADYCIVPVVVNDRSDESQSSTTKTSTETCDCETDDSTVSCATKKAYTEKCNTRVGPILFRHAGNLLSSDSEIFDTPVEPFKVDYVGRSDEIGKWGKFFDLVERVLRERDNKLLEMQRDCCDDVCVMPRKKVRDPFEDLDRFKDIELFGFSAFCRGLMRWSSCTTKRWDCITKCSHLVIHLPSMSFPCHLRSKVRKQFGSLQNIQIGRLGWLVNEKAQVVYVYPGKSNFETKCILQNFVKTARPDISFSRLWIIVNDDECFCKDVAEEYRSGCESLFYTPNVYRRVRHLTAGRHGFIIPGVLSKTDVLIACELKTSIIGPCLKFQKRLLNKHYVMSLLSEANIRCPPFASVRNFEDLCETIAEMMTILIGHVARRKIKELRCLVKVNCGFCGNQNALVCLDWSDCESKENLLQYLHESLPRKIILNTVAYKDVEDFLLELERHGGVLTACPPTIEYKTVSLGCFIEHDTAKACLRTTADVVRDGLIDIGYIIPQTTLPDEDVKELVRKLGDALLLEPYVGFFGVDIVVFTDWQDDVKVVNYWVVDIDPYYTDLLSFEDWRRFCLNIPICASFSANPSINDAKVLSHGQDQRFVVCSGKLYKDGFSLAPIDFFDELCVKNHIGYSPKAKSGCMLCPIDIEKRSFLLFSICITKELALKNFVRALKALHSASTKNDNSNIISLAHCMEKTYGIKDNFSLRKVC